MFAMAADFNLNPSSSKQIPFCYKLANFHCLYTFHPQFSVLTYNIYYYMNERHKITFIVHIFFMLLDADVCLLKAIFINMFQVQ